MERKGGECMNDLIIWLVGLTVFPILIDCGEALYWEIRLNIKIRKLENIYKELEQEVKQG